MNMIPVRIQDHDGIIGLDREGDLVEVEEQTLANWRYVWGLWAGVQQEMAEALEAQG